VQFWFQTKEGEVELNKIQAYLSEHYGKNADAFQIKGNPVVGKIYGINHPIYDGRYRGRVEKSKDGAFEVNFVDFGDTQTVSLESIHGLLQEWADIPSLATRCSWTQSIDWSQTAV
jgi:ribosomal protein L21E